MPSVTLSSCFSRSTLFYGIAAFPESRAKQLLFTESDLIPGRKGFTGSRIRMFIRSVCFTGFSLVLRVVSWLLHSYMGETSYFLFKSLPVFTEKGIKEKPFH